jgi:lysyl-tRNA synthetase, class II
MAFEDIQQDRLNKLKRLKDAGVDPYPASSGRTHTVAQAREAMDQQVTVAGRLRSLRPHGKISFADLADESAKMQLFFSQELLNDNYSLLSNLDVGDFVEASGQVFTTQAGEVSVKVSAYKLLSKSIRPLPSQWYGLKDTEERLRRRYVDLAINPDLKRDFVKKSTFWSSMRSFLIEKGFLEVETPVLQPTPGGADARPFVTHHFAQDMDLYLRISPELYLKRLLVGGFEKVFEIGRIFRNEGIDDEHLQDYTQMEFYWAYADYNQLMELVQQMYQYIIQETFGTLQTQWQGQKIDWSGQWGRVDYFELLSKEWGVDAEKLSVEELYDLAKKLKVDVEPNLGRGRLLDYIYKKTVRPHLIQPFFLINPPVEVEPLAKRNPDRPDTVQRLQILAMGSELGKGFSELNDPIDQRERFEEQAKLREAGDEEAQFNDVDFVEALEYGMPPAAGFGISERLFSMLVDKPIREMVFFPTMKPEVTGQVAKQDFSKKMVIIVDDSIEPWKLSNTIGHISAYLGNKMTDPFDTGKHFTTKDGKLLPRNSQHPIVTLSASKEKLSELVSKVRELGLPYLAYVPEMIEFIKDSDLERSLGSKEEKEVEYLGVGTFGSTSIINELTKGLDLFKGSAATESTPPVISTLSNIEGEKSVESTAPHVANAPQDDAIMAETLHNDDNLTSGINRAEAYQMLTEMIQNKNLVKHGLSVEAIMRALYQYLNSRHPDSLPGTEEDWAIVGLLHDADYEVTNKELDKHTLEISKRLKEKGVSGLIINAIQAHSPDIKPDRENLLERAVYCADELSGLITAVALVRPEKKLSGVTVENVMKKFPEKNFAAGAKREQIAAAKEELGIELEEFVGIALASMQEISDDLGL